MIGLKDKLKTFARPDELPVTDELEPVANDYRDSANQNLMVRQPEEQIDTIVSMDVIYSGNLMTKGIVSVEGVVEGDMNCEQLMLLPSGSILGAVVAQQAILAGHVRGNIFADQVMVKSGAHIEGDIYHKELSVEFDAVFEGRSHVRQLTDGPS